MARKIVEEDLPRVTRLCKKVIGEDYLKIARLGGLTNRTYYVAMPNEKEYIVRIPGEGTEELIERENEEISTKLACSLGIDAKLLYFGKDGSKVTEYISKAITMSADSLKEEKHIKHVAEIFLKLHTCNINTGVPFEVFDMADEYEKIIYDKHVSMYEDYTDIKEIVNKIKDEIDNTCKIKKVPCHNDPLCENWIVGVGKMYLVDWEYAGMNDSMWDLADVSIEAGYNHIHDEKLLIEYLGRKLTKLDWKHFLASKIYVDYLWTLWAKARVPYDGQPMEDWATERYTRLKKSIREFNNI